jgi:hypothetical protein
MRNVVFVSPFLLENTMRFVRAVARLADVRVLGICQAAPTGPDAALYADVELVQDGLDTGQILRAARALEARNGPIHRVLGILEHIQVQLGEVREAMGLPGVGSRTAELFRDKARMKDELRAHGLPCARHRLVRSWEDARAFVAEVGLPIVLKPTAGAGCKATWRIGSEDELRSALNAISASPENPALAEEFLRGREYSFETFTLGGEVVFTSASRYFPTPLEVMETPWIQWSVVLPRAIDTPEFGGVHELGVSTVRALGLDTGMTHMEWFRRDDGSLAIGEIAARPPGARIVLANSYVFDVDMYREWARLVVDGAFDGPWERKHAVGVAFLRGIGHGRVTGVYGVDEANRKLGAMDAGDLAVYSSLPTRGAPRADTYEGDGFVVLRHPDTEVVKAAVKTVIETIRVTYG